jgi:hypothetical protein
VVHFIGFRGDEYWSAVKIWGEPHFIHRGWDKRAQRDIDPADLVIFATGDERQEPKQINYNDLTEGL